MASGTNQLRRYPVTVRARGKAERLAPGQSVLQWFIARTKVWGAVHGHCGPGNWLDTPTNTEPQAHLLFVPMDARAQDYPRSLNGVPVRILRTGRFVAAGQSSKVVE